MATRVRLSTTARQHARAGLPPRRNVPSMVALRRAVSLAAVLVGEIAAVVGLHALAGQPWVLAAGDDVAGWLARSTPADAVMGALRLAGLALAWWMLATTTLYLAASLARRPGLAAAVGGLTMGWARRLVDRAVVVGVSAALVAPSAAWAQPAGPPMLDSPAELEGLVDPADPGDFAGDSPGDSADPAEPDPPPADSPPPPQPGRDAPAEGGEAPTEGGDAPAESEAAAVHTVQPGEHLWRIAAQRLASHRGVAADELATADVAVYWREVVAANADRVRSGDPDLVYPGEVVRLPKLPPRGS